MLCPGGKTGLFGVHPSQPDALRRIHEPQDAHMSLQNAAHKMPIGRWVSDKQLAEYYNVHRATVHRMVKTGDLPPPIRIGKGNSRWDMHVIIDRDEERMKPIKPDTDRASA
jgi:predicted DNA-binding transcriptional regulator AlpA